MKSLIEFLRLIKDLTTGTLIGFGGGMLLFILFSISALWIPLLSVVGALGGRAYTYFNKKYNGDGSKFEILRQLKELEEARVDLDPIEYLTYRNALKKRLLFGEKYDEIFSKEYKHKEDFRDLRHEMHFRSIDFEDFLAEHYFRFENQLNSLLNKKLQTFFSKNEAELFKSISHSIDTEIKSKTKSVFEEYYFKNYLVNKKELDKFIIAELKSVLDLLTKDINIHVIEKINQILDQEKNKQIINESTFQNVISSPKSIIPENQITEKSIKKEEEEFSNQVDNKIEKPVSKSHAKTRRGGKSKTNTPSSQKGEVKDKNQDDDIEDDGGILDLDDLPKRPQPVPVLLENIKDSDT